MLGFSRKCQSVFSVWVVHIQLLDLRIAANVWEEHFQRVDLQNARHAVLGPFQPLDRHSACSALVVLTQ